MYPFRFEVNAKYVRGAAVVCTCVCGECAKCAETHTPAVMPALAAKLLLSSCKGKCRLAYLVLLIAENVPRKHYMCT